MADEDKPFVQHVEEGVSFKPNRIVPLVLAIVSGGFVALNHYQAINDGKVNLWMLFLGPLFCLLGIGGLIDPRIAWSFGPKGQNFPAKIKILGGLLIVLGLAISAYLALGVYRLQEVRTSSPPDSSTDSGMPR